ncbi:AAA family ATPase [Mesorhizobium sp.]|uniref:trifunctional serine/threonine-protein kinase/ATP-binding protein/sensor histidine kinase n=4 Tax=unclassified Mesorhizobium TaxID=325217 RepID=UPI0025D0ECF8|nr:AAA family ATPase [Mesorhizobium sp.]
MSPSLGFGANEDRSLQVLWADGEYVLHRTERGDTDDHQLVLALMATAKHSPSTSLQRLAHEYALKDELDETWAVRPLQLVHERGRTMLLLEDPGGEPLARLLDGPMDLSSFLSLAVGIAKALGSLHECGLVHKDIKPANIMVGCNDGLVRLTGFGLASRLPRERPAPDPPEAIAGTLAYMAPEQTGRMNRSIDSRSDLYAFGVTLYQMVTGTLPFTASEPLEWVHCHIARRPLAPVVRTPTVPPPVSQIIMKLLAKTAEERYQTALGVENDLRRCLVEWERVQRIEPFPLARQDLPDRLLIPEKLYGRGREVDTLLAAFDRVVGSGRPELILISGYSGIGKTSVVHELHKELVPPRGLFAFGKFDQYKRDIPYATLVQAIHGLVRPLLGKGEAELVAWRHDLLEALGPNGRLMVDLVPELKLIIGEQPPVPELPPQQAQIRFHLVFRRFIGVFARPEHPLALFLDDLQWLDLATLDLIEDILIQQDVRHLMLVGAYRDNEVSLAHPLMHKLNAIRKSGSVVNEIVLAPLAPEDLERLTGDSLRHEPERVRPLAQLIHEKTAGNPFFAIQFTSSLAEEGLLAFDHREAQWSWDIDRIHAKGYTDNVVDLLLEKLSRLPVGTQRALQKLACLGASAELDLLTTVYDTSMEDIHSDLWEAVRAGLVLRSEDAYRFLHDRVQEAAYSLIPEDLRAAVHLRIGRLLEANTPPHKRDEVIFEIVNQLNRGAALITAEGERLQLAELNLIAGKRAKAATAYASALNYFVLGGTLLPVEPWTRCYDIAFAIDINNAECELLTGNLAGAEERLSMLQRRAASVLDRAATTRMQVLLHMLSGRPDRAIEVGLQYLREVGIEWSAAPTDEEVGEELESMWRRLEGRSIEALYDLPLMSDPQRRATMDVLLELLSPGLYANENLESLLVLRMVNLSIDHGNCDASAHAYASLNLALGVRFGDYESTKRFSQLSLDLVGKEGFERYKVRVHSAFGVMVLPWIRPFRDAQPVIRRALEMVLEAGELTYAGYLYDATVTQLLSLGTPLAEVQRTAEHGLQFAQKLGFDVTTAVIVGQLGIIKTLRGLTPDFGSFSDDQFDESRFEQYLLADRYLALPACWYWIRKLQALILSGRYDEALEAGRYVQRFFWTDGPFIEAAEYHFYDALARAAAFDDATPVEQREHLKALGEHHKKLVFWAGNCPENFENRAALVEAEIARLQGRELEAERLYERAVGSAREQGFMQNEGLAYEWAARFYRARGFDEISHLYFRNARRCYLNWGADGKVRQLDQLYPHLRDDERALPNPTTTIQAPVDHLDLATVLKVSQSVSGEMILEKLLDTVMRTAIEQAGAQRGVLLISRGAEQRIVVEAITDGDTVTVQLLDEVMSPDRVPASVLRYVEQMRESVVIDQARADNPFSEDSYFRAVQARSVLCLPLLNQSKLIGLLYLENNLASGVFAPTRIPVLKLLASQAAISLENTRLYMDLTERETKIRRLVDANIIGIFFWDIEGRITEANEALLRMVGYDRDDLASGRLRWTDLTPAEWLDRDLQQFVPELKIAGSLPPFEKEYLRKDGTRLPVLIGVASFEERGGEGVAFVLDLTGLKRAEAEARENERRYREIQSRLARANRVATMGQLTASIAHEVNQPIAAALTNGQAALRWLSKQPPDLMEVQQALERIVKDGTRAGEIIDRMRALFGKAPPSKADLDINEVVGEIVALTQGEALKNGVTVRAELEGGLPVVRADRVQLQQVVLNLIANAIEAMSEIEDEARDLHIITAQHTPDGVIVTVRDTGPGLTFKGVEDVFEALYTTKPTGLGMGLPICRTIIEAHGGKMWASANKPRGAIFQFTLPQMEEE